MLTGGCGAGGVHGDPLGEEKRHCGQNRPSIVSIHNYTSQFKVNRGAKPRESPEVNKKLRIAYSSLTNRSRCVIRFQSLFQSLYVGLPGLDAIEYVEGEDLLGVALSVLMRIPGKRIIRLGADALRRLARAPLSDQKRFLLSECVEAYFRLDESQEPELEQMLETETYTAMSARRAQEAI